MNKEDKLSIKYIHLNSIITKSGVSFSELIEATSPEELAAKISSVQDMSKSKLKELYERLKHAEKNFPDN